MSSELYTHQSSVLESDMSAHKGGGCRKLNLTAIAIDSANFSSFVQISILSENNENHEWDIRLRYCESSAGGEQSSLSSVNNNLQLTV